MVGGFANNNYWSSTENDNNNAWKQNFNNGNQNNNNKNNTNRVRAVRGFKQSNKRPNFISDAIILKTMQLSLFSTSETTDLKVGFSLEEVFDAPIGTPESDVADLLAELIDDYENKYFPIEGPEK